MKFFWPVRVEDGAFINVGNLFGANPQNYIQFGLKGHNGTDFIAKNGTPIHAAHDGLVEFREDKNPDGSYKGFGRYARITNEWGSTYYAHQLKFEGKDRQVRAGNLIGYVDTTGYSTGPHLHFGFRPINADMNNGYGGCVDPQQYLAGENEKPFMAQIATQKKGPELRLVLKCANQIEYNALCAILGKDPAIVDETL